MLLRLSAGHPCADTCCVSTRSRTITQRPIVRKSGARVHFIDDRLETLRAVSQAPDLRHVQLYLAAWCAPCWPGIRMGISVYLYVDPNHHYSKALPARLLYVRRMRRGQDSSCSTSLSLLQQVFRVKGSAA